MRKSLIILMMIILYQKAKTQTHGGFEQYYYSGARGSSTIVPKIYYQTKNNWYGEARYNYDALETFSFSAGKTFEKGNKIAYTITPIAGLVIGKLNGASMGVNGLLEYKNFFLSTESQYTLSAKNKREDVFFNWSELGYQCSGFLYAGIALQLTHLYKQSNVLEPGAMVGFTFKSFTFPAYIFSPFANSKYFVLGINWQWQNSRDPDNKKNTLLITQTGK